MPGPFSLNIATAPLPGAGFVEILRATDLVNGVWSTDAPGLTAVYLDSHFGDVFQVDLVSGRDTYTFILDAYDRVCINLGVPISSLTFYDLLHQVAPAPGAIDVTPYPPGTTIGDYVHPGVAPGLSGAAYVLITGAEQGMVISAATRGRPITAVGDTLGNAASVAGGGLATAGLYNPATGLYEAQRTPTIWKAAQGYAGATPVAVWTPASSRTIRLLGGQVACSVAATVAADCDLLDGATAFLHLAGPASQNMSFAFPGNGRLLSGVNMPLTMSFPPGTTVNWTFWGTEE